MTDLVPKPVFDVVVDPVTGEALEIGEATTDTLGAFLANVRDLEGRLREQKNAVSREIVARMDREGKWTARLGAYKLTAPSPEPSTEYDAEPLYAELDGLVEAGTISADARDRAVSRSWAYKVSAAGVKALLKLPAVAPVVEAHSRRVEKDRRVSVSVTP